MRRDKGESSWSTAFFKAVWDWKRWLIFFKVFEEKKVECLFSRCLRGIWAILAFLNFFQPVQDWPQVKSEMWCHTCTQPVTMVTLTFQNTSQFWKDFLFSRKDFLFSQKEILFSKKRFSFWVMKEKEILFCWQTCETSQRHIIFPSKLWTFRCMPGQCSQLVGTTQIITK